VTEGGHLTLESVWVAQISIKSFIKKSSKNKLVTILFICKASYVSQQKIFLFFFSLLCLLFDGLPHVIVMVLLLVLFFSQVRVGGLVVFIAILTEYYAG